MEQDWYDEQDANDEYLYGKDFTETYDEPDITDWKAKGW